jgi:hypothetical protein
VSVGDPEGRADDARPIRAVPDIRKKEHAPAGLPSQIDSLVSGAGSGTGGIVSGIAGMLGATKDRHE